MLRVWILTGAMVPLRSGTGGKCGLASNLVGFKPSSIQNGVTRFSAAAMVHSTQSMLPSREEMSLPQVLWSPTKSVQANFICHQLDHDVIGEGGGQQEVTDKDCLGQTGFCFCRRAVNLTKSLSS